MGTVMIMISTTGDTHNENSSQENFWCPSFSIYIFSSFLIVLWCFRRVPDLITVCPKVLNWLLPLAGIGCLPRFEYSKVGGALNIQRRRRSWIFNPASAIFKSSIQAPPGHQPASHLSAAKAATSDLNICPGFKRNSTIISEFTRKRKYLYLNITWYIYDEWLIWIWAW